MFVRCLNGQVATMNREKGGRHNQFLGKWLKEFGWLQARGSGDDLSMICKDCTKATLANIALIIPVSSASCERGFSWQNRIKTGLRNRLFKENLENLMKVAIEGPRLQNLILREHGRSSKGTLIFESSDSSCLTLTILFCSVYLILSNDHTLVKSCVVNTLM